jgi:alanine-glyoxylate transaminase/serine-glyoxylate transaminase/serine-pyruvate transaminase
MQTTEKTSVLPVDISAYPLLAGEPRILLGPGPSMIHPRVLQSMAYPLYGHLDPQFLEILQRTQELLRYVYQTENTLTLAVPGTGMAAMEAAFANFVEAGDAALVFVQGFFGGRMADMARRYGAQVTVVQRPYGEVFSMAEIRDAVEKTQPKVVGIVHAETSAGVLQPLEGVAEIVHAAGGILIVDMVTSLGGLPAAVDARGIDVCYSGTQKCLGVPPGLAPVTVAPGALERLKNRKTPAATFYLNLLLLQDYWNAPHAYHHTAPISMHFAFYEGLRMIAEEGLENRWTRHQAHAEMLWEGLQALGMELFVPTAHRLPTLTTVRVPDGVDEAAVRARLLKEYRIEVGAGLGEQKGKIWRIGLMGHSSRKENVLTLLMALKTILGR